MSLPSINNCMSLSVIFTLLLFTSACSNRSKPAPVVVVEQGITPSNQYVNKSINTKVHTVKKGETLYAISWRSNVDIRTIASINNLKPPYQIYPGQKLFLTKKSPQARKNKSSSKKQQTYATNTPKKNVAHKKKQAYGENRSEQKASEKVKPDQQNEIIFAKDIRVWQWPVKGRIIAKFSNSLQGNKGIDIAGVRGSKIRAAADGKVVYAGDVLRGYGKLVIIKHNNDYLSAYAHNDKILVKEQQIVKAGDVITTMGSTDAQQVMLHFEVRYKGKSVNPLKYLP